ncbi:hypothetical protein [Serratia marcescens]|uniref:hypothetical protein n=1 Tax=Serratia marcescens TaxID=615 RepID=UPI0013D91BF7|nr:hypothetical protein [Serratia marcescens]
MIARKKQGFSMGENPGSPGFFYGMTKSLFQEEVADSIVRFRDLNTACPPLERGTLAAAGYHAASGLTPSLAWFGKLMLYALAP